MSVGTQETFSRDPNSIGSLTRTLRLPAASAAVVTLAPSASSLSAPRPSAAESGHLGRRQQRQ
jgi:hypothetical protein